MKDPTPKARVLEAVAIAAFSAAATGLVNWGLERLKERKKKKDKSSSEKQPS